jgi:uncharacterized ion transporter superfamily protein YfcC
MLQLALGFSITTTFIYVILVIIYMVQYKKKVKEYENLEKVNEQLLVEKYDLKNQLGRS